MSRNAATFPRQFQAHPFGELDRTFLLMVLLLTMFALPTIWRLKEMPVREVSRVEHEQYLRIIYRAAPAPQLVPGEGVGRRVREITGVERAPGRETVRERSERRRQEAQDRNLRRQERLARARSTGIFTAAGAQMPSFSEVSSGALSLSGGSLAGLEAGSMSQLIASPDAEAIAGLRAEGLLDARSEQPDLVGSELEDVELSLAEAEVVLDALPVVRGRASAEEARSEEVLRRVIGVELDGLRACYLAQRRKDATLRGSLDVRFVILPPGEVTRVRFRNSVWTNPALGRRVERCLTERITSWRFDPANGGEVTLEFPIVFK